MRRFQLTLAIALLAEGTTVLVEAARLAERMTVTSDGTLVPSPWLYPSPFSAGLALVLAVVLGGFLVLFAPPTKQLLLGSIGNFVLGSIGLWSFHRGIVWIQGIGHGFPAWR
ncbi:MAG TPA: hypothetical protein VLC46_08325 [Thermoanaerobaculia bacterium]|jgi:hypothetical protein|nr:hypothetical protein [Thermoanaerobaculia bacterium]